MRGQFFEKTLEMCGLNNDPDCHKGGKHKELWPGEIKKGENAVKRTMTAIKNFTNPFTISEKDQLFSLASGAPVSKEVELDVLGAEKAGKKAKELFISERFEKSTAEVNFFDPVKKLKLLTMEANNKKKLNLQQHRERYFYLYFILLSYIQDSYLDNIKQDENKLLLTVIIPRVFL